jgi:hypothetical protein
MAAMSQALQPSAEEVPEEDDQPRSIDDVLRTVGKKANACR